MMLGYYLDLARRSLKRNKVLTALMVLAIGLGIGASMTMVTVLHVMSGDPLPGRSGALYVPMLNVWSPAHNHGAVPDGFTWPDAMNLLREQRADGQAAMVTGVAIVQPRQADVHSFEVKGQFVTAQFFSMFGVPFREGAAGLLRRARHMRRWWFSVASWRASCLVPRRRLARPCVSTAPRFA